MMQTIWFHYAIPISKLKEDACLYTTRTKPYRLRRDFLIINTVSAGTCSKKIFQYAYHHRKDGYDELLCLLISHLTSTKWHFYNIYLSRSLRRDSLKHLFIMQSPQGQFRYLFITQSPQGQFTTFIYKPVSAGTTSRVICRNFIAYLLALMNT
jgi:hypothetical protein